MAITGYSNLKYHFDRLVMGQVPSNNLIDPIRDIYKNLFNQKIGLYDVFRTEISVPTNPIRYMISIVNSEDEKKDQEELQEGIMFCGSDMVYSTAFEHYVRTGINKNDAYSYIMKVYQVMENYISKDTMYRSDKEAEGNPYLILIKALPFYFTYFHIKDCLPGLMSDEVFGNIIEKYITADTESIKKILDNLNKSRYSNDIERIYYTMTCGNTVKLFD